MHRLLLATAALSLAAVPAFAQTNTPAGSQMNQSGAGSGSGNQMSGQNGTIRQQLTQQLSQAGFTDIRAMPESFLVRAKDPQGRPVMMVINPDSITAVTAVGNQGRGAGGAATGAGTMANSGRGGSATNTPNGNTTTTR